MSQRCCPAVVAAFSGGPKQGPKDSSATLRLVANSPQNTIRFCVHLTGLLSDRTILINQSLNLIKLDVDSIEALLLLVNLIL